MAQSPGKLNSQGRLLFHSVPKIVVPGFDPYYSTDFGDAYLDDSLALLKSLPDASVTVVLTSPPYALHFKKEYGNAEKANYIE